MALPVFVKAHVEAKLSQFIDRRCPSQVRDRLRLGFSIRGNSVTLFEERPCLSDPSRWTRAPAAQLRYDLHTREWTLFCADRNSRWQPYWQVEPNKDLDVLLREVEEDPTGIFWG